MWMSHHSLCHSIISIGVLKHRVVELLVVRVVRHGVGERLVTEVCLSLLHEW